MSKIPFYHIINIKMINKLVEILLLLLFQVLETWCILYTDSTFLFEAATLQVRPLAAISGQHRASPCEEAGVPLGWEHYSPAVLSSTNQRKLALDGKMPNTHPSWCQLSRRN